MTWNSARGSCSVAGGQRRRPRHHAVPPRRPAVRQQLAALEQVVARRPRRAAARRRARSAAPPRSPGCDLVEERRQLPEVLGRAPPGQLLRQRPQLGRRRARWRRRRCPTGCPARRPRRRGRRPARRASRGRTTHTRTPSGSGAGGTSSGSRPDVGQVVGLGTEPLGEARPVEVRVLRDQVGPVRAVQRPRRPPTTGSSPAAASSACGTPDDLGRELGDLASSVVSAKPRSRQTRDHRQPVGDQRRGAAAPHEDGRVVGPAVVGQLERPQDLQGLHPLLAQPRGVQQPGALGEVGHRQEGLHRRPVSVSRRARRSAASQRARRASSSCPTRGPRSPSPVLASCTRARAAATAASSPARSPCARRTGHAQVVQQPRTDVVGQRRVGRPPAASVDDDVPAVVGPLDLPRHPARRRRAPAGPRPAGRRSGRRPSRRRGWARR